MKKRVIIISVCVVAVFAIVLAGAWFLGKSSRVDEVQQVDDSTESVTLTQELLSNLDSLHALPNLKLIDARGISLEKAEYDALCQAFPNVQVLYMVPLSQGDTDNTVSDLVLTSFSESDLALLSDFPNLKTVDGTACDCPQLLMQLEAQGNLSVLWSVPLCGNLYSSDTSELAVEGADAGADEIIAAAALLPNLKSLDLTAANLSNADNAKVALALPDLEIVYYVSVDGQQYAPDTQDLDLSGADISSPDLLFEELSYLTDLKSVNLTASSLTATERGELVTRFPSIDFYWTVEILNMSVDSTETTLDLNAYALEDNSELMQALAYLPALERVDMCECGLDDYQMAELADAYPAVRFIWEIDLGFWGRLRTDATAFTTRSSKDEDEMKYRLTSEDIWALRYCVDLEALDLGHQQLTDISALANCTKLKVLILADNQISDLSPLANMTELIWVELFINRIEDLSPLANLTSITDLNLCTNRIEDLTPLYSLSGLKRLWYSNNNYSTADAAALAEALSSCHCNRTVWDETSDGWRETEEYLWMRSFFENSPRYK
ncbi:MAG: leucine-rich repeat domain-containing protein [Clostridia bacterium]|nr:leucine-rich repeat domain-containing protein [Clostridia bacterium]